MQEPSKTTEENKDWGNNNKVTVKHNLTYWAYLFCVKQSQRCLCANAMQTSILAFTDWQIPAVRCLSPDDLSFLQTAGLWFPFSSSAYSQTSHPLNLGRSLAAPYPNWKLRDGEELVTEDVLIDWEFSGAGHKITSENTEDTWAGCRLHKLDEVLSNNSDIFEYIKTHIHTLHRQIHNFHKVWGMSYIRYVRQMWPIIV